MKSSSLIVKVVLVVLITVISMLVVSVTTARDEHRMLQQAQAHVRANPNDALACVQLGDAYWDCNMHEEPIQADEQAVELDADYGYAYV